MNRRNFLISSTLLLSFAKAGQSSPAFPPPKTLGNISDYGKNIQRTMTLLASSSAQHRQPVKILFYGQSITEQKWTQIVSDDLRRRFPHANLIIENRAIGGHSSQRLVKTAEADLYPFYPDLVIFHVYGSQIEYEKIIRRIRERTTAEILLQNDHLSATDTVVEETDPSRLSPKKEMWPQYMNYAFLPSVARKYNAEFCDQRAIWKQYLRDYNLRPQDLLKDGVHLNAHGEYLMAECVKAYLRYDPKFSIETWKNSTTTYHVGREIHWQRGNLILNFDGNRIDALFVSGGKSTTAQVLIDGRKPSQFPELYGFTRVSPYPNSNWPCLLRVQSNTPLLLEQWMLTVREISPDHKLFKFKLEGSQTGADGEGASDQMFISRSGRVVIDPADWNLEYAFSVFKKPIAPGFQITWNVLPYFVDEIHPPTETPVGVTPSVTLAQNLSNDKHRIQITGNSAQSLIALRVYKPPLTALRDT